MTATHLDTTAATAWLGSGLALAGSGDASLFALRQILAVQTLRPELPPPGFVWDVYAALLDGSAARAEVPEVADPDLARAHRLYHDQVRARLLAERRLDAARDALARLPPELKEEGVAVQIVSMLARLAFDGGVEFNPAITRNTSSDLAKIVEMYAVGTARLRTAGPIPSLLADGYRGLVVGARALDTLLTDSDVYTLENLRALRTLAQRLIFQQIANVAEEFDATVPVRISRARSQGDIRAQMEEERPRGGIATIATRGPLEHMLPSEAGYMDEPGDEGYEPPEPGEHAIDIFDVRWLENQLLRWQQTEDRIRRRRHLITFVLQPGLESIHVQDPRARWRRSLTVLGLVLHLVRSLSRQLGKDALVFHVVLVARMREVELALTLVLGQWLEQGALTIETGQDIERTLALCSEAGRSALSDVLVLGVGEPLPDPPRRVNVVEMDFSEPNPAVLARAYDDLVVSSAETHHWPAWVAAVVAAVRWLL